MLGQVSYNVNTIVIKKNIRVAVGGCWRYRTKGDGKMMCGDVSALHQPQPGSDASGTWNKSSRNQAKAARGKKKT